MCPFSPETNIVIIVLIRIQNQHTLRFQCPISAIRKATDDTLHETADFRTDYEIIRDKAMRGIIRKSKVR